MRSFEFRIYTLRTPEALAQYAQTIYPRHIRSMGRFGVELRGFWTKRDDPAPRLFALVSYAEGQDPGEVAKRYLRSADFAEDTRGFDTSTTTNVGTTILEPLVGSPLT